MGTEYWTGKDGCERSRGNREVSSGEWINTPSVIPKPEHGILEMHDQAVRGSVVDDVTEAMKNG